MKLIDEFVEKVLNTEDSFNIVSKTDDGESVKAYHFLQSTVGKGRYIYGVYAYGNEQFYSDLDLKPKLVAIVADNTVYIIDRYFMGLWKWTGEEEIPLPKQTFMFDSVVAEKREYLKNVAFLKFYDSLETVKLNENEIVSCKRKAREILLSKNPVIESNPFDNVFSIRTVAEMLCGLVDIDTEARKHLEKEREKWVGVKSFNKSVEELINTNTGVDDWEITIAKGLRTVDAKTVTVEFEFNGKKASAKMNPDAIRRCILNDDYFSGFNFANTKRGDELIEYLSADTWRGNGKNVLTCKHISKITYRGKNLYVRS